MCPISWEIWNVKNNKLSLWFETLPITMTRKKCFWNEIKKFALLFNRLFLKAHLVGILQTQSQNVHESSHDPLDCKWLNCRRQFRSMDELVSHVNDHHVRVERPDIDYQCKWDGCPRKGKGFNARFVPTKTCVFCFYLYTKNAKLFISPTASALAMSHLPFKGLHASLILSFMHK